MKKMYVAIILLLALFTSLLLTGCGTAKASSEAASSVAIVIGNHMNSRELNLASQQIRNLLETAVESEGLVSVVVADGEPNIVAEVNYRLDDRYRNASASRLAQDVQNKVNSLLLELVKVRADDPEVDTLDAIRLAARTLGDAPTGSRKTILVLDTGLSTVGLMSFGNNLLGADPAVIADMLETLEAIPEMRGVQVVWQHMGDVAAPQEDLSPRQKNRLADIWRTVMERGGAAFELSTAVPNPGATAGLPKVSCLTLPKDAPITFEPSAEIVGFQDPVFLNETLVQFIGDSEKYIDRAKAESVLQPVADYMLSHGDVSLLLVGTTAGDANSEYTMRLSCARANTVRDTLVALGVRADRFVTLGMGSGDPWHIYGVGVDSPLASQNRKVVLVDMDTDTARRLLE